MAFSVSSRIWVITLLVMAPWAISRVLGVYWEIAGQPRGARPGPNGNVDPRLKSPGRESNSHTIAGELNPKMEAAAAEEVDEGKMRRGTGRTRGLKITVRGCVVSHYTRSLRQHRHDRHVVFVIAGSCISAEDTMAHEVTTDMMLDRDATFFDMISIIPQLMILISSSEKIQVW
jgi:hypothetical protein